MAILKNTKINPNSIIGLPKGTTAERPVGAASGMLRFNTDLSTVEIYNGTEWLEFASKEKFDTVASATGSNTARDHEYVTHTWLYRQFFASLEESSIGHSDADYKVLKTFTATEKGLMAVHFTAYIQSGTYYFAYRIRKNSTTTLVTGDYRDPKPGTGNVHVYRDFYDENLSVDIGDIITVEMISSTGSGVPVTGNGQILYCKNLKAYYHGGQFTPQESGYVEVLVVAGGGSGGTGYNGGAGPRGGGGAGGLIYQNKFPVVANVSYTASVGVGGYPFLFLTNHTGTNGGNSVFGSLTAIGGGAGSGYAESGSGGPIPGRTGGSGGGNAYLASAQNNNTNGQGFWGGGCNTSGAGGGGGAGGPGRDCPTVTDDGGAGGPGLCFSISGEPSWYAGGGGAGAYPNNDPQIGLGGAGGGGSGGSGSIYRSYPGINGTGGGGGGGGVEESGEEGGSGIIVVRYICTQPVPVVHEFNEVGSLTWTAPTGVTSVEVLVVGGGGGGGNATGTNWGSGGGGGGGGVVYSSSYPVIPATNYTVTVGAGGTGGARGSSSNGTNGGNSVFDLLTAVGGGAGASANLTAGSGGSGGGQGYFSGGAGTGTPGQGFNGGTNGGVTPGSGGGGGAGGPGVPGQTNFCGQGGPGKAFDISGKVKWYGGGGGGGYYNNNIARLGLGGIGGGGEGGQASTTISAAGKAGVANTGGGGGGGSGAASVGIGSAGAGGNGGSGTVVIKYYPLA